MRQVRADSRFMRSVPGRLDAAQLQALLNAGGTDEMSRADSDEGDARALEAFFELSRPVLIAVVEDHFDRRGAEAGVLPGSFVHRHDKSLDPVRFSVRPAFVGGLGLCLFG